MNFHLSSLFSWIYNGNNLLFAIIYRLFRREESVTLDDGCESFLYPIDTIKNVIKIKKLWFSIGWDVGRFYWDLDAFSLGLNKIASYCCSKAEKLRQMTLKLHKNLKSAFFLIKTKLNLLTIDLQVTSSKYQLHFNFQLIHKNRAKFFLFKQVACRRKIDFHLAYFFFNFPSIKLFNLFN